MKKRMSGGSWVGEIFLGFFDVRDSGGSGMRVCG
jgi:hypothetical protein